MAKRSLAIFVLAILLATPATAHVGIGSTSGFLSGVSHPLSGLDHILAMVMIGAWASMLGSLALWLVPATFVTAMAAAGALGAFGLPMPFVELLIAGSVIGLGAMIALNVRVPIVAGMAIAALFAVAHGHAHGAEMPETAAGLAYGIGFVVATVLLHGAGIGLGIGTGRLMRPAVLRWTGAVASATGFAMLLSS